MIGRTDLQVDLNNLTKCDAWKFEGVDLTMPMNVTNSSTGLYKCSSGGEDILMMSIGECLFSSSQSVKFISANCLLFVCLFVYFI